MLAASTGVIFKTVELATVNTHSILVDRREHSYHLTICEMAQCEIAA
jgi:hypothetical protein